MTSVALPSSQSNFGTVTPPIALSQRTAYSLSVSSPERHGRSPTVKFKGICGGGGRQSTGALSMPRHLPAQHTPPVRHEVVFGRMGYAQTPLRWQTAWWQGFGDMHALVAQSCCT